MISSQYEKPQLDILMFELEDVLTSSAVVHTTSAPTTLPGTTSGGVEVGKGDIVIDFGDFFK
ncbi:MAG: hypothetical protein IIX14_07785 [Clostridia bacterium]|jgi:hypothetical protein|nr:hypothetical protein [Clostridia bacterium]